MTPLILQITQALPAGAVFESFLKYAGGLVAIGTVLFIAGKVAQAVDYLKATVELLKARSETHGLQLTEHGLRIDALEKKRRR